MPKQVTDVKQFLEIARRKDATSARVKKTQGRKPGSPATTKFKIRCSKYLYTFISTDADKAEKLRAALPPALGVTDIDKTASKKSKAKK